MGQVASMNPDNMAAAGLADDFVGTVTKVRLVPWDYNGNLDHEILAAVVSIEPDEDSGYDPFDQHYSAGDLEFFAPSMDGENPVELDSEDDEEREGIYAIKVGRRDQLNNNSNWAHFIRAAIDAGFPVENLEGGRVDCFEGTTAKFDRITQQKRSGIQRRNEEDEDDKKPRREKTILVMTDVISTSDNKEKPAKKKATKKATKKAAASSSSSDTDEQIINALKAAMSDNDGILKKSRISSVVVGLFKGPEKVKNIRRANSDEFLSSVDAWVYDEDEGILALLEE